MDRSFRLGDYLLGIEGLAIVRAWATDSDSVRARSNEIASICSRLDVQPYSVATRVREYDAVDGYGVWAVTYDQKSNILIRAEEPVVRALLAPLAPGRALDAACGTGPHAAWLASGVTR